ncbi:hypothetical protein F4009_12245 [Candidatus Poribacteria bacterium]|nr:hypothetical protein [Candidatus Poribacteria bacterium]MYH82902.1 hypothetical protein [Candidatus Poribacteria bacterium]MYK94743.1 hypothetical protein [Candidatus Poribacteria bacterium]
MRKDEEATRLLPLSYIFFTLGLFLSVGVVGVIAETASVETDAAASTEPDTASQKPLPFVPGYVDEPETEPNYQLFRSHPERYYPELDIQKAKRLSTFMPGLGQAYAGNYTKATLFLTVELSTFALAGYNIARALHYNKQQGFETGFQDMRTGEFLTYDQGQTRMKNHAFFSGIFLATGIGIHIWNILDAPKTAEAYNNRRFSLQVQQTGSGLQSLVFTHRF